MREFLAAKLFKPNDNECLKKSVNRFYTMNKLFLLTSMYVKLENLEDNVPFQKQMITFVRFNDVLKLLQNKTFYHQNVLHNIQGFVVKRLKNEMQYIEKIVRAKSPYHLKQTNIKNIRMTHKARILDL